MCCFLLWNLYFITLISSCAVFCVECLYCTLTIYIFIYYSPNLFYILYFQIILLNNDNVYIIHVHVYYNISSVLQNIGCCGVAVYDVHTCVVYPLHSASSHIAISHSLLPTTNLNLRSCYGVCRQLQWFSIHALQCIHIRFGWVRMMT